MVFCESTASEGILGGDLLWIFAHQLPRQQRSLRLVVDCFPEIPLRKDFANPRAERERLLRPLPAIGANKVIHIKQAAGFPGWSNSFHCLFYVKYVVQSIVPVNQIDRRFGHALERIRGVEMHSTRPSRVWLPAPGLRRSVWKTTRKDPPLRPAHFAGGASL